MYFYVYFLYLILQYTPFEILSSCSSVADLQPCFSRRAAVAVKEAGLWTAAHRDTFETLKQSEKVDYLGVIQSWLLSFRWTQSTARFTGGYGDRSVLSSAVTPLSLPHFI